jgi:hypothetical protein
MRTTKRIDWSNPELTFKSCGKGPYTFVGCEDTAENVDSNGLIRISGNDGVDMLTTPGDIITAEDLKTLYQKNILDTSTSRCPQPFFAFLLDLRRNISARLGALGRFVFCVQRRGDLHLLQGAAASEYNEKRFEYYVGGSLKTAALFNFIDTSKMSPDQLERHKRAALTSSSVADAVVSVSNRAALNSGNAAAIAQLERAKNVSEWIDLEEEEEEPPKSDKEE